MLFLSFLLLLLHLAHAASILSTQLSYTTYHAVAPVLNHFVLVNGNPTLINGLSRYQGGPTDTELAVVNVEYGKRYRLRLIGMSCDPNFLFSIDGQQTDPLLVDSLQILAGQRYSVVLNATQPVDSYWIRALPSTAGSTFDGGQNSAILRYQGAPVAEPTKNKTISTMLLLETNLHAYLHPGAHGIPEYGKAGINLIMVINRTNGIGFEPPSVPVLLQIPSGAQEATDILPDGSVYVLEPNAVVELTMINGDQHGPIADNFGPWFLHCHIDWHLEERRHMEKPLPDFRLFNPILDIGAENSYQEAVNLAASSGESVTAELFLQIFEDTAVPRSL
ncbi:Cupredoxin [Suillus lakei]|nr:Cupredoxin [Suillus lakei]